MLNFAGETLPFEESYRWTQADYVVLYIQQTQRMLDPTPGILRYFQTRQPEHIVRITTLSTRRFILRLLPVLPCPWPA